MHTVFAPIRLHVQSIVIFIYIYFIATWISDSPLLSFVIGIYGISPILTAILKGEKLTRQNLIASIIAPQSINVFLIVTVAVVTSALPAGLIAIIGTKWMASIIFAALYAVIFKFVANKIYSAATGKKGIRLHREDLFIVSLSIFAISITEIATDYLFASFPYLAPLCLLLRDTVFVIAFVFQAALIFARNDQSKTNDEMKPIG